MLKRILLILLLVLTSNLSASSHASSVRAAEEAFDSLDCEFENCAKESVSAVTDVWMHNYYKALREAKRQNKDVYLFIGADECRFCDRFKAITLSQKSVINRLKEEYVLLYLSRDHHNIPSKFEKYQVPRHYFLNSKGFIMYETRGSREVAGFNSLLDEVDLAKDD